MKGRKGVSPLIAVVLLIVFTVAVSTMIMSWMNTYTKDTTSSASSNTEIVISCSQQSINIPTSSGVSTDDENVTITVENNGQATTTVKKIIAYEDNSSNTCIISDEDTELTVGDIHVFEKNCSTKFGTGVSPIARVRATTTCGGMYDEWTNTSA